MKDIDYKEEVRKLIERFREIDRERDQAIGSNQE